MISDVDLDRVLTVWFADGGDDRAPEADVEAALAEVERTPQRRSWRAWFADAPVRGRTRWVLIAAALLLLAIGIAVGVGAITRPPTPPPEPPAIVEPAPPPVPLAPIAIEDWPPRLSLPAAWTEVDPQCCDFRQFGGDEPVGHLSLGHESPYTSSVCDPACHALEVPQTIPYDATKQIESLRDAVAEIAGTDAWRPLPAEAIAGLVDGSLIDTTGEGPNGETWRRVYIVGLKARNLVTFAFSQPAATFDQALLDGILASIDLGEAPQYSDGDPIPAQTERFAMDIPGSWITPSQPDLDGTPLSGVWRFGDGEVLVSIGTEDGTLGWCAPGCVELTGLTSLDALETAVRGDATLGASAIATLDGEPARAFGTDEPTLRRWIVAMHDGRPVAIRVDAGAWDTAPDIPQRLFDSFRFIDPARAVPEQVLADPGGRFEVALPAGWTQVRRDDGVFLVDLDGERLAIRVGDDDGTVTPCEVPAGPFEQCEEITAQSLDELATAVAPAPSSDPGIGPPMIRRDSTTIDGEPAVIFRLEAYEPPAKGGQHLAYVVAIHDGRPYILRFWTGDDRGLRDVDEAIAGFRFTD